MFYLQYCAKNITDFAADIYCAKNITDFAADILLGSTVQKIAYEPRSLSQRIFSPSFHHSLTHIPMHVAARTNKKKAWTDKPESAKGLLFVVVRLNGPQAL
jgi:hypothetical protein